MPVTVLAASHGTSSPAGQAAVRRLVELVGDALPVQVVRCHVDVEQPSVPAALAAVPAENRAVIVPLLLSAGYHVYVDLAEAADASPVPTQVTGALGPDRRLVEVLARRLSEAGYDGEASVVLAAAGSSDARAVDDCLRTGELLAARLSAPVEVGFLSAAAPTVAEAVAAARAARPQASVIVAPYLLAPGYFLDLVGGAGADVVAEPLITPESTPRELVDVVVDLARAAGLG
ncbi:sirohydrochlorin chelatase [Gryllotalpicola daejeonensis]|uniref:Sirohydrochlorin chelatase n=1 Tax=Gryllotalpicola daejeonensis TaxID=993087 RepID=A0ABP7ZEJ2_9MICO